MALLRTDTLSTVLAPYAIGSESAVADPLLLQLARQTRRRLSAELRPIEPSAVATRVPEASYLVTRKFDGEFCLLICDGTETFLLNPGGTVRVGLPLLEEARSLLPGDVDARTVLAGELYVRKEDLGRERVHDVVRLARRPPDRASLGRLAFAAFDVVEYGGGPVDWALVKRWDHLGSWLHGGRLVTRVPGGWAEASALPDQYEAWVTEGGAEGIVARNDAVGGFKVKARHALDVVVVGFSEGSDDRAGLLHDLLVAVQRPDGLFHMTAHVGGGFTDEQRRDTVDALRPAICESRYLEVNSEGVAYQMVRPEWVVEITCLDLITETSAGLLIDKMVAHYDADGSGWQPVRRLPLASLISPQFIRRRDDKAVHPADVGIAQLTAHVAIERALATAEDLALPRSELLRRQVWVKKQQGNHMVRKLLLWRTNKEGLADFPAYVVYGVDYSPNRADPLQRDIQISNDLDQINRLYLKLRDAYVKRGWEEAADGPPEISTAPSGPLPY